MKIGFIGLGYMGAEMVKHLIGLSHEIYLYNRTASKMHKFAQQRVHLCASVEEVAKEVDVVITVLSTPQAVREIEEEGLLTFMKEAACWIECSTIDPALSVSLAQRAEQKGIAYLDAPIVGNKLAAREAQILFLVSGKKEQYEKHKSLFSLMSKKSVYLGKNDEASKMKLVINHQLAFSFSGFVQSVKLGKLMGFEEEMLWDMLEYLPMTAPFISSLRDKLTHHNLDVNFPLRLMIKDLGLIAAHMDDALLLELKKEYESVQKDIDVDFTQVYYGK